jgi:hypothetical protein
VNGLTILGNNIFTNPFTKRGTLPRKDERALHVCYGLQKAAARSQLLATQLACGYSAVIATSFGF